MNKIILFGLFIVLLSSFTYGVCDLQELQDNTIAFWNLSETTTTYFDSTTNNLDFTGGRPPTRVAYLGDYGQDFEKGSTNTITTATNAILDFTDFTFVAKFKPESSTGNTGFGSTVYISGASYGCSFDYYLILNYDFPHSMRVCL